MSTVKISELPVLSSADAADEFVVVDDSAGVTKKITQAGLADFGSNTLTAGGITFGSDTLDDYEEGTWTPEFRDSAGTLANDGGNSAHYVRIGNFVHASFRTDITSVSSNNLRLTNPPFAAERIFQHIGLGIEHGQPAVNWYVQDSTEFRAYRYSDGSSQSANLTGVFRGFVSYRIS